MATKRISMINAFTRLDTSGLVNWEPHSLNFGGGSGTFNPMVIRFQDPGGADRGFAGLLTIPKDYVGTPVIVAQWGAVSTTGSTVAWQLRTNDRTPETDDMDPSTGEVTTLLSEANSTTARRLQETTASISDTFAVDDIVMFDFQRDDSADGLAADVHLFALIFEYADA